MGTQYTRESIIYRESIKSLYAYESIYEYLYQMEIQVRTDKHYHRSKTYQNTID